LLKIGIDATLQALNVIDGPASNGRDRRRVLQRTREEEPTSSAKLRP
jgi:hypothetical protein